MSDVTSIGDALVAVGNTAGPTGDVAGAPAAWTSADGLTWHLAEVPGATSSRAVTLSAVTPGGRGVVAVGPSPDGRIGVWVSTDGRSWVLTPSVAGLSSPDELTGTFAPADVAASPDRIVAVGDYLAEVWTARSGAVWVNPSPASPFPSPSPASCPSVSGISAVDVLTLRPDLRVTCFGRHTLRFRAFLSQGPDEGLVTRWLTERDPAFMFPVAVSGFTGGAVSMEGYLDGGVKAPSIPSDSAGRWFAVEGHFDDARASTCTATSSDPTQAIEQCRERFVVTALAPASAP